MAKNENLKEDIYSWTSGEIESTITRSGHGDLSVYQVAQGKRTGVGYYDNHWRVFPQIIMKYISDVDAQAEDAKNWKEVMKECGWEGEERKSPSFDYLNNFLTCDIPEISHDNSLSCYPGFAHENGLRGAVVIPVINDEKELVFLQEMNSWNIEKIPLSIILGGKKRIFEKSLVFTADDSDNLFRGVVEFTGSFRNNCSERMNDLAGIMSDWDSYMKGLSARKRVDGSWHH